jgi:prepilin-type N-terminal cleavage/methylation domain-containing protein
MALSSNQHGFTLIEFIVVMIVLGILVLGGVFGLRQVVDGYGLARDNSVSTQKVQNALDRMVIELSHVTSNSNGTRYNITAGTAGSISYTANFGGADENHTIDQNGSLIRLDTDDSLVLTDQVTANGLQFSYLDGNGNAVNATDTTMRLIGIALTVQVTPGVTRTFNARVALQQ